MFFVSIMGVTMKVKVTPPCISRLGLSIVMQIDWSQYRFDSPKSVFEQNKGWRRAV